MDENKLYFEKLIFYAKKESLFTLAGSHPCTCEMMIVCKDLKPTDTNCYDDKNNDGLSSSFNIK